MDKFTNLLVYAGTRDSGKAALDEAADLARRNGARITLFDVVKPVPGTLRIFSSPEETRGFESELCQERRDELNEWCTERLGTDVEWIVKVGLGRAGEEIVRAVLREEFDLVLKSADGAGRLRRRLFGSVGMTLLRNCPCPVWIVRPERPGRHQRIVAAVDVDSTYEHVERLNDQIVELAASLAETEEAELHVVHAWHLWMERALRGRARFRPEEIASLSREHEEASRSAIAKLLERAGVVVDPSRVHVMKGEPDQVVPEFVDSISADLLVMGTVCRTGVAGFVIGNTAERILEDVHTSVLTVKPRGFVCPIAVD